MLLKLLIQGLKPFEGHVKGTMDEPSKDRVAWAGLLKTLTSRMPDVISFVLDEILHCSTENGSSP